MGQRPGGCGRRPVSTLHIAQNTKKGICYCLGVKRPAAASGGGGTRLPRNPPSAALAHLLSTVLSRASTLERGRRATWRDVARHESRRPTRRGDESRNCGDTARPATRPSRPRLAPCPWAWGLGFHIHSTPRGCSVGPLQLPQSTVLRADVCSRARSRRIGRVRKASRAAWV